MSKPQPANSPAPTYVPPLPLKAENTRLDFGFLADLALKTVYADANCATDRAAEKLKLSMPVTEELLQHLYREKFIEIRGLYELRQQPLRHARPRLAAGPATARA